MSMIGFFKRKKPLPAGRKKENWRSGFGWLWGREASGNLFSAERAAGLGGADAPVAPGLLEKALAAGRGKMAIAGAGLAVLAAAGGLLLSRRGQSRAASASVASAPLSAGMGEGIHAALPSPWGGEESVSASPASRPSRGTSMWDRRGDEPPRPARRVARGNVVANSPAPTFPRMGGGNSAAATLPSPASGGESYQAPMGGDSQNLQAFSGGPSAMGGGDSAAPNSASTSTAAFNAASPGSLSGEGDGSSGGGGMEALGALERASQIGASSQGGATQESAAQTGAGQFDGGPLAGAGLGTSIGGAGDAAGLPYLARGTPASLGGPSGGGGGASTGGSSGGSPSQAPSSSPGSGSGPYTKLTGVHPPAQYAAIFAAAAAKYGVPESFLAGIAKAESNFNPKAYSSAGAEGMMQFMPGTAAGYHIDPWNPAEAIPAAAQMLAGAHKEFGRWSLAAAAYNAGAGAVAEYHGIPPYPQTEAYVPEVMGYAGLPVSD